MQPLPELGALRPPPLHPHLPHRGLRGMADVLVCMIRLDLYRILKKGFHHSFPAEQKASSAVLSSALVSIWGTSLIQDTSIICGAAKGRSSLGSN